MTKKVSEKVVREYIKITAMEFYSTKQKVELKEIKKFGKTFAFHHSEFAMNQLTLLYYFCFVIVWSRWFIWSCCLHYNVTYITT